MLKKKLIFSFCAAVLAGCCLFTGVQNLATDAAAAAGDSANAVSAVYVETDTTSKGDWATAGYGDNGYLVFDGYRNGAGAGVYSDMYTIGDTDTTVGAQTLMTMTGGFGTGWTTTGNGGWDITFDDAGAKTTPANTDTHVLKSDAIVSSWAVNACTFQGHGARTFKPYIPGTTTNSIVRLMGKVDHPSVFWADVNIGFTLNTEEKVYVTLQICDYASGGGNTVTTTDSVVQVYNAQFKAGQLIANQAVAKMSIEGCYGTDVLATANVTTNGSYVTFLLDGSVAKEYMFVVYGNNTTAATYQPMIGGVFFDEYVEPEVIEPVAAYAGVNNSVDGTGWESADYGTDGYVVYYTADNTTYQAYTKGIYKNEDGTDYTGLVTYSDAVKGAHNEWKADKELSGKIITRYANAFTEFATIAEKSWKDEYATGTLTIPGTTTPTWTRVSSPRKTGNGVTAFTVPADAFKDHKALEVTIFHCTAFGDKGASTLTTAIYNIFNCGDGDSNDVKATPIAAASIVSEELKPLYVTYRITAPGDYTIYLFDDNNTVRATTTGIFFDYVEQGIGNVSYVLNDGVNSVDNSKYYAIGKNTALADATKEGFDFDGWYLEDTFATKVTEIPATQTEDLILYANFVKAVRTFNIEYVLEGGEHSNPATYTEGTAVTLADATREGYTFEGWYLDIACMQKIENIPATQTGDLVLYAKFVKIPETYDIIYNVYGGEHTNPVTYTEGSAVVLSDATKEGYTFDGWYLEDTFATKVTEIPATQTGDIILYAKFTANPVVSSITYELDGGINADTNPTTYTEGQAVALANARKEGYTFDGWYLEDTFATKVTEIPATQTGDIILYAKFTLIELPPDSSSESGNTQTGNKKGGCGSVITVSGTVSLVLLGAAVVALKKKKNS